MMNEQRVSEALVRVEAMGNDIAEIKSSVKEMASAITKLAVVEERQAHDRQEIGRVFKQLGEHNSRIGALELAQPLQKQTTDWVQKAVWLVVGAVISGLVSLVIAAKSPATKTAYDVPTLTAPK